MFSLLELSSVPRLMHRGPACRPKNMLNASLGPDVVNLTSLCVRPAHMFMGPLISVRMLRLSVQTFTLGRRQRGIAAMMVLILLDATTLRQLVKNGMLNPLVVLPPLGRTL